ncbi:hypothetical protein MTR_6g025530 [Medicago truncatula]|uniref:PIF1 helicase n=1 Tax=Medicago truncatula TaxID=3880 RepID=G7KP43_MEDTR|nr:hypothetical protein MTR_6g025530 [Medicago truncatula]
MFIGFSISIFRYLFSFVMTINKSQGQSLNHVGILLIDEEGNDINIASNVVYKEVFQNVR